MLRNVLTVLPQDFALHDDRVNKKRTEFLQRRWGAGVYSVAGRAGLQGTRHMRIPAALADSETVDLEKRCALEGCSLGHLHSTRLGLGIQHQHSVCCVPFFHTHDTILLGDARCLRAYSTSHAMLQHHILTPSQHAWCRYAEILEAAEAAALGLTDAAPSVLAVATSHFQFAQGKMLEAMQQREARLKEFSHRVRAARAHIAPGALARMRQHKTDDVVRDTPLPEFKINLASLARLLQPVRPLRPQKRAIKKIQVRCACFDDGGLCAPARARLFLFQMGYDEASSCNSTRRLLIQLHQSIAEYSKLGRAFSLVNHRLGTFGHLLPQASVPADAHLTVNIQRASNLPTRAFRSTASDSSADYGRRRNQPGGIGASTTGPAGRLGGLGALRGSASASLGGAAVAAAADEALRQQQGGQEQEEVINCFAEARCVASCGCGCK